MNLTMIITLFIFYQLYKLLFMIQCVYLYFFIWFLIGSIHFLYEQFHINRLHPASYMLDFIHLIKLLN